MAEAWGSFQLLERVSESEATENFRAQNDQGELVWLKRARKELLKDEGFAPLLLADLKAAAELKHPHVLPMIAHGEVGGVPYLVQPMVAGWTLSDLINQARGTPLLPCGAHRAAAIVKPVLEALAAAHALTPPLLHRDLSPDDVMIAQGGKVVLANFGLSRARQRAGSAKGLSRAYVSVEQARGQPVDARSEVFAAGLLLFELTCGRLPAQGTAGEVISRIASYELEAATAVNPNVDRQVVVLLEKALAQSPADRFASAREFAEALAPLVPADAEALVGQWADLIDDEQPTRTAKVEPKQQVRVPADSPAPVAAAAAQVTAKTPATPVARKLEPKRWALAALSLAAVVALALAFSSRGTVSGHPEWPVTTIASTPIGAEVYLDGTLLKEHTPVALHLEPNSMHSVLVRRNGMMRSPTFPIQNSKHVDVDLGTGEVREERYVEGPPTIRGPQKNSPQGTATQAQLAPQKPEDPAFKHSVSELPADVLLDEHYQLPMDNVATRELKKGDRLEQLRPMGIYAGRGAVVLGNGDLDVFALWNSSDGLQIASLAEPAVMGGDGTLYLAAVSREGGLHGDALLRHQSQEVNINNLRVPEPRNLFEVTPLDPALTYCFTLGVQKGQKFGPVLGGFLDRGRPLPLSDDGTSVEPELDGKPAGGPAVMTAGRHVLKRAQVAWFTVPTLEGAEVPAMKLHFEVCPEKKPAPGKKK